MTKNFNDKDFEEALAEQPAQQEPVARIEISRCKFTGELGSWAFAERPRNAPAGTYYVYTSPPAQRTWVGLTHDEYDAICDKHSTMSDFDFLEDIEAKLKEKNT